MKVKEYILAKNKGVIVKHLHIKEEQCISRIIKLYIFEEKEWYGEDSTTLESLHMKTGKKYCITIRFVRALAYLSENDIKNMVTEVDSRTQGKYPKEMIV